VSTDRAYLSKTSSGKERARFEAGGSGMGGEFLQAGLGSLADDVLLGGFK
jgi:hypothetical protein